MAFILATILILLTGNYVESYINTMSDFVKQTRLSCPGVFDCKSNSTSGRVCSCDDDCVWKNTCCYDAPAYDKELIKKYVDRIRCSDGKFMLSGCDEGWGHDEIRELCEAADPNIFTNTEDPLLYLPVTSKETGVLYSNYYCAVCSYDAEDVFVLDYDFSCDGDSNFEGHLRSTLQEVLGTGTDIPGTPRMIKNNGFISKNLDIRYNIRKIVWDTTIKFGSEYHDFKCTPFIVQNYQCECEEFSFTTDKCDANWNGTEVEELCRSFKGQVVIKSNEFYDTIDTKYRNIFCAICNFVCIDDSCTPTSEWCFSRSASFKSKYPIRLVSGSSTITKKNSNSTCKDDEHFFPGYCHGGENKLLCAMSPSYHRPPLCVKRNKEERVRSFLAQRRKKELSSETTPPLGYLESFTMSNFVNQTLSYCPGRFDCKSRNYTSDAENCDCDDDCARRSTCCYDASASHEKELIKKHIGRNKCVTGAALQNDIHGTEIFFGCDEGWEDDEILNLCKVADPESFSDRKEDLILHLPVTSNRTHIVYANRYCAICNDDADDIVVSGYKFYCKNGHQITRESDLLNILNTGPEEDKVEISWAGDLKTVNEHYNYKCMNDEYMDGKHWDIRFNDSLNGVEHLECKLLLDVYRGLPCGLQCFDVIEKCDDNWNDSKVEDLCRSFKGIVRGSEFSNKYRNVFCAICNHESISSTDNLCHFGDEACDLFTNLSLKPSLIRLYKVNNKSSNMNRGSGKISHHGFLSKRKHGFLCKNSNPLFCS